MQQVTDLDQAMLTVIPLRTYAYQSISSQETPDMSRRGECRLRIVLHAMRYFISHDDDAAFLA